MAIKVSEMQELRDMGSPDNKYVYVVTESQGGDGNEYNKMSLRTIVDNAGGNPDGILDGATSLRFVDWGTKTTHERQGVYSPLTLSEDSFVWTDENGYLYAKYNGGMNSGLPVDFGIDGKTDFPAQIWLNGFYCSKGTKITLAQPTNSHSCYIYYAKLKDPNYYKPDVSNSNPTPHPCFTYDDNRFITGVHQVSPPNEIAPASDYYIVTQKYIYDDYALGIITLGGKSGSQLEVLECPNVEYISSMAVNNVPLVRAIFPNLRRVGTNLFSSKGNLTYVDLGKIEEIPVGMFYNCSNLNNVTIPNTTTQIGNQAFYGCTSLESIVIPDSVTSIGESVFNGCTSLASVTIGNGMTSIGYGMFRSCSGLTSVTIPNGVTSIESCAFYGCTNLAHLTLSQNLTKIGGGAFQFCESLESVTIPASVTELSGLVFYTCSNLKSVYFDGDAPTGVTSNTFTGVSAGAKAYVYSTAQGFPAEGSDWYGLIVEYRDAQTP